MKLGRVMSVRQTIMKLGRVMSVRQIVMKLGRVMSVRQTVMKIGRVVSVQGEQTQSRLLEKTHQSNGNLRKKSCSHPMWDTSFSTSLNL